MSDVIIKGPHYNDLTYEDVNVLALKNTDGELTYFAREEGKVEITDTNETDVTGYETAQVKDNNLVAPNIKKDITILGITGTYEGGGGSSEYSEHGVFFIDYDGTLIEYWPTRDVQNKTALPANPNTHSNLIAQGWNWSLEGIKTYVEKYPEVNMYVGQLYETASGKSEFDITLVEIQGLTVIFNVSGTKDWGDGTSNSQTVHTYAKEGNYTITTNANYFSGGTTSKGGIFGGTSSNTTYYCTAARLKEGIPDIPTSAFLYCECLKYITMPSSIQNIGERAFYQCRCLSPTVIIPQDIFTIDSYAFYNCYALEYVSLGEMHQDGYSHDIISYVFYNDSSLKEITLPEGLMTIGSYAFGTCNKLQQIIMPDTIIEVYRNAFYTCRSLGFIRLSKGLYTLPTSMCSGCSSLKTFALPSHVEEIENSAFLSCLALQIVPDLSHILSIGNSVFNGCHDISEYNFSNATSVPSIGSSALSLNGLCQIKVPKALEDEWKTAPGWTGYAPFIIGV